MSFFRSDATFCALAGVDATDHRAAAADLPPIDSHSLVPVILGTGRGSRSEILLGTEPRKSSLYPEGTTINGLISEDEDGKLYKLLTGAIQESGWTGPHYPNSSTDTCCFHHHASGYYGPGNARGRFCPQAEMCVEDCADGRCLYETRSDPTEHHNLAAQMPGKVAAMLRRIDSEYSNGRHGLLEFSHR